MSASKEAANSRSPGTLDEEQVRDYLKNHPDFLERHPDMLDFLHVSHSSGSAVSLVEKQVSVLRERNMEMRHRLNALTNNARENDKRYDRTRQLILKLLDAKSLEQVSTVFVSSMREDFEVEQASLILFGNPGDSTPTLRFESTEKVKLEVGGLLKGRKPLCGALREEELRFLFPKARFNEGSAALMPLKEADKTGLIAIGSADASHYYSGMGTLFLRHVADVLVRLLDRMPTSANA
ncbi:MAG: DUF484 family protein [Parahaliea sp.]